MEIKFEDKIANIIAENIKPEIYDQFKEMEASGLTESELGRIFRAEK